VRRRGRRHQGVSSEEGPPHQEKGCAIGGARRGAAHEPQTHAAASGRPALLFFFVRARSLCALGSFTPQHNNSNARIHSQQHHKLLSADDDKTCDDGEDQRKSL
jgi:hypothetical protein